ncbi:MAG: hypothetical protein PHS14_10150 [Elusimicrobia bacterium]|nr:hypothetical protein [Elusimicrobiota bacterium]
MLVEFPKVAQERGAEGPRRWFSDDEMDLIVWFAEDGVLVGFELCYGKSRRERAYGWRRGGALSHFVVDDGESTPLRNDTPILTAGGEGDRAKILADFLSRAAGLERGIVDCVGAVLRGD